MKVLSLAVVSALMLAACAGNPDASSQSLTSPMPTASPQPAVGPLVSEPIGLRSGRLEDFSVERPVAPTRLRIDELDISMPIAPVGVDADGAMEIPQSAATAGWYKFGPSPATGTGNTVIAAHVDDARIGLGPFSKLLRASVGDTVDVTLEDDSTLKYRIVTIERTDKQEVDLSAVFAASGTPLLVLVTCGGRYNWDTRSYNDNVIVWAELVSEAP